MVNNRQKMYTSNARVKKWLLENGYKSIYLYPHLRFMKDYSLEGEGYDGHCFKEGDRYITFFQIKSNEKPSKQRLEKYKEIEGKYFCRCLWFDVVDREGVTVYGLEKV